MPVAKILATKKVMHLLPNKIGLVKLMTADERPESEDRGFLRFVIVSTLTVVGMALCIMSPWLFYICMINLGMRGEPLNYVAIAAFWSFFVIIVILATVIDWVMKRKKTE